MVLNRQKERLSVWVAATYPTSLVGKVRWRAAAPLSRRWFPGSARFWEAGYASGRITSGPGSAGGPATYKADFVNGFAARHGIRTVIEFGCGDGRQLALANYESYVGLDVSPTAVQTCSELFAHDLAKSFFLYNPTCFVDKTGIFKADLALSLDVMYHLVEDEIYQLYLQHLFAAARSYVIVYSTNFEDPGSSLPYTRNRHYTAWIERNLPEWSVCEHEPNPHAGSGLTTSEFRVFQRLETAAAEPGTPNL